MARRDSHPLVMLGRSPWRTCVLVAGAVYVAVRVAPSLVGDNRLLQLLAAQLSPWASWIGGFFLLAVPVALARAFRDRQLLDLQTGIDSVRQLSWERFEALIGEAYRRQGYTVVQRGGSAPDGGVDLELRRAGIKVLVQCKQWRARKVGVRVLRELYGTMVNQQADAAIVVTTGEYTPAAAAFADGKPVTLITGGELAQMIGAIRAATTHTPSRIEPHLPTKECSPRCPRCGDSMVRLIASAGSRKGERFWGCSRFPECRGIRVFETTRSGSPTLQH